MDLTFRDLAKPGPSLAEVLKGLARGLIADIEGLPDNSVTRIHDIRVSTKKIQGLLRLSGKFVNAADQAAARTLTRSIRSAFAGERDEEILRQRQSELLPKTDPALLDPAPVSVTTTPAEALVQARQLEQMLAGFSLDTLHSRDLIRTATASYRKARQLLKSCRKGPEDEPMHTWRKRVKDVSYQSLALAELPFLAKRTASLDRLADLLGEYHDLAVLQARLGGHSDHVTVVAKHKKAIGKAAFKLGARLLDRPPARFAKKLSRALRKHAT
ncbi:CHAD domain-containing protein [soil metagenome]